MNVPPERRERHIRRTKIVATIGPATSDEETLRQLIEAGVDVARLNFSHGTAEEHEAVVRRIRRISNDMGRAVGILQDLQGPRLRTGTLAQGRPVILVDGDPLVLTTQDWPDGTDEKVWVSHPGCRKMFSRMTGCCSRTVCWNLKLCEAMTRISIPSLCMVESLANAKASTRRIST